jgi:hypothetical protein
MEDVYSKWHDRGDDLICELFGIFDGRWGQESVMFARKHLMECTVNRNDLCSDKDEDIMWAIQIRFQQTHLAMWIESHSWPKSVYEVHMSFTTAL